jgi:hypothetical protein
VSGLLNPYAFGGGGGGDPYWSNVKLLCGFEGADGSTTMTDESTVARTLTAQSTAQIDTAQFKYGASSLLLNGTSDYVTAPNSADFDFGSGEFTIEGFFRFTSTPNDICFLSFRDGSSNGWRFGREGTGLLFNATGATTPVDPWTPSTNTWHHICVDRDGSNNIRTYFNGAFRTKKTSAGTISTPSGGTGLSIGRLGHVGLWYMPGHIDELRITKGTGRYASDSGFTVPAAAYPRS